jgi:CheY-like chemotaxis protein
LASAFGIVKNHHGIITVDSLKGQGATFTIYLPASSKVVTPTPRGTRSMATGAETILLVDDETLILGVGRAMLEKLGYQVITAGSGDEALRILETAGRVDLVILDLIMPGMDGGQTFDHIRKIDPTMRVLLSSGYALDGQAAAVLNKGCRGFIQKPFTIHELSGKIRSILDAADPPDP